jgi:ABC-type protease/lipase transport system fused ATPase/permease subunit
MFMLQVFDRVLASQSGETLLVLLIGVGVALALLLALDCVRARLQGLPATSSPSRCRRW